MKIIVSTKAFAKYIKHAIDKKTTHFEIIGEKSEIVFSGKRTTYGMVTAENKNSSIKGPFDLLKWYKVWVFITALEEQPIVVEFNSYDEDGLDIELSQFIKRF